MQSVTTPLAILGVLAVEPSTGYGIRQSISTTIGHFWSESYGQIYPTLAELEKKGLVRSERVGGHRILYTATPSGMEHLSDLLRQEHSSAPTRDATLLRLFFGRFLGREGCKRLLLADLHACELQLKEFGILRENLESTAADDQHLPYWLITLRNGELATEARIAWATESLAALEGLL